MFTRRQFFMKSLATAAGVGLTESPGRLEEHEPEVGNLLDIGVPDGI